MHTYCPLFLANTPNRSNYMQYVIMRYDRVSVETLSRALART